ncbi:hypothetical protein nvc1_053 [Namao virus]|nr:hypothetical protein nvc1_053 [Namao virus]
MALPSNTLAQESENNTSHINRVIILNIKKDMTDDTIKSSVKKLHDFIELGRKRGAFGFEDAKPIIKVLEESEKLDKQSLYESIYEAMNDLVNICYVVQKRGYYSLQESDDIMTLVQDISDKKET